MSGIMAAATSSTWSAAWMWTRPPSRPPSTHGLGSRPQRPLTTADCRPERSGIDMSCAPCGCNRAEIALLGFAFSCPLGEPPGPVAPDHRARRDALRHLGAQPGRRLDRGVREAGQAPHIVGELAALLGVVRAPGQARRSLRCGRRARRPWTSDGARRLDSQWWAPGRRGGLLGIRHRARLSYLVGHSWSRLAVAGRIRGQAWTEQAERGCCRLESARRRGGRGCCVTSC
jgi:hypothetical protein